MDTNETPDPDKNRFISLPEAAQLYGFSARYLSNLAKRGRIKAQKIGNFWVTTPKDMEAYIRSRKRRGVYREDIQLDDTE